MKPADIAELRRLLAAGDDDRAKPGVPHPSPPHYTTWPWINWPRLAKLVRRLLVERKR